MLKKVLAVLSLLILSILYLSSSGLFFLEKVNIVKGEKSKGSFKSQVNYPFVEKTGVYKSFDLDYDYVALLEKLDAKLIHTESLSDVKSYYFYTKNLSKIEIVNGQKVNLQIAVSNKNIVVGTPIIYGGY